MMTLSTGTKLGSYEITGAIGAGGMGEVYRARDAKLGRDVALKVLPEAFARDAERMARFQREAKVLASLNHPNIASIYGLEDSGVTHALVMELVEGLTLADRIKSGPIPISEALPIAKQICDALEYAHERGVVHRDLKPANVKVTNDDAVKVLDFGLAKAIEGDAASMDITTSPTMSRMATEAGVLLGTAAYMSPEQAKGRPVDRRADIWAFGCVLYEMLTGKMAFSGETVTDTLAAVIMKDPDWSQLPAATPVRVRVLLQRCLQKDPKQRLRDIGDARISLDEILAGAPDASLAGAAGISAPPWRRGLPWAMFAASLSTAVALAFVHFREKPPAPTEPVRFEIPVPEKTALARQGVFAVSPDGRQLAFFAAGSDGVQRLWVRPLDSVEARPLPSSESSSTTAFFWSPDSQYIAFDAGETLKKINISTGEAETLCDLPNDAIGGSWNRDGVIIFGQNPGGLMRVSANGGSASPLTNPNPSRKETYDDFPTFLPDGRHFIYLRHSNESENSGVYIGSLDAKLEEQDSKRLLATQFGAGYVPSTDAGPSQLLFIRDGTLMAQPFDANRLELVGEPVLVVERVGFWRTAGYFSASANGVLVYRTGGSRVSLSWFDRDGEVLGTVGEAVGQYTTALSLSPDGMRAAATRADPSDGGTALWLLDLSRGTSARFTFGPAHWAQVGIWSPDGNRIIFASDPDDVTGDFTKGMDLYQRPANGANDQELLLKASESAWRIEWPTSWSRDGRFLLYTAWNPSDPKSRGGLWVLRLAGDKKPFQFLGSEFDSDDGQFSPDGNWVAYRSNESGRQEIYVRPFSPDVTAAASDTGGKWLISTEGGRGPRWRGDGKELYYIAPDWKLMAVEIATKPVFRAGVPKVLFQTPLSAAQSVFAWDVTPDGKRFLFPTPAEQTTVPFTVVLNWQAGLKK
jgi:Tol biopolymer transport system component